VTVEEGGHVAKKREMGRKEHERVDVERKKMGRSGSGMLVPFLCKMRYRVERRGVMCQKEGNGGVHMGFALSDIRPKAFTSEKYFIIQGERGGNYDAWAEMTYD
jgi:hypothetical protein